MINLDLSAEIAQLRSTFSHIRGVLDPDALAASITALEQEASAPDLWDDPENAQAVTSRLSHAQADLKRITGIEQRLDDLEVLVELANEADDADTAAEAERELGEITRIIGDLEVQTLLDGEFDPRPAVMRITHLPTGITASCQNEKSSPAARRRRRRRRSSPATSPPRGAIRCARTCSRPTRW